MVSEGVDIPRLRVGVYATSARTELFFRQVVGRFIRRTPAPREQMSHLFLPSDPTLKRLAAQIEEERNHALSPSPRARRSSAASAARPGDALPRAVVERPPRRRRAADDRARRRAAAVRRGRARAVAGAGRVRRRDHRHDHGHDAGAAPSRPAGETAYERRERLREERRALVAAISRRTGEEHRAINARVNRDVGAPSVAKATVEQLEKANRLLEREAAR